MPYKLQAVSLDLTTDVTHECYLHYTRDQHMIGVMKFYKEGYQLKWEDLEYIRRRTEEFSVMPYPDCIVAMIVDIRDVAPFIDQDVPIIPWRLVDEECPIRIVVPQDRLEFYSGFFEPTWLTSSIDTALSEIRTFMDMFVH
ncbi:hypothetical protein P256_01140 [Acinetobacter nectaris CIP 110549]|uniref:Uncharacterized protein n=1 Tax=Acinetobacter nectaris CIP 110549 TaxID=1392540 RepID=V2TXT3_9GAMM|nr:hypothetical protein [Acinetobacter nectaris]ESK40685.1 hypothetical protein P256_01140 [Acinetobacter nectaris CIP 110549]MCF8998548.1 hypothetical protein [Acinetobacter nectaris]MCF9027663.1 hypothetical protein [Acinetobacter nectaris]